MGKQNNLFESLQIKDGRIVLRSEEDIDMLFLEFEKRRLPIANNLDTIIRMSIQKLKLQKYYAAKLKDYRKWLVETPSPKASISNAGTISKAQIKKLSKAERKRIREEKRKIVREKVNNVLSSGVPSPFWEMSLKNQVQDETWQFFLCLQQLVALLFCPFPSHAVFLSK